MQHHLHQMSKVDTQEITTAENQFPHLIIKKSERNHSSGKSKKKNGHLVDDSYYQIDEKILPFIFRFNYVALRRLKMKKSPDIPKLAYEIFDYLMDKIKVRRCSEGAKYPNRMKYQEKVKFLMRSFDHRRPPTTQSDLPKTKQKFNRKKQLQFFTRPQVRQHFLQEINNALMKKKMQNQMRIRALQDCIQLAITFLKIDPSKSYKIFQLRIKRRQLPWTNNMFQDIEQFSKQFYSRYSSENIEAEEEAIKKQMQEKLQQGFEDDEGQQIESIQKQGLPK